MFIGHYAPAFVAASLPRSSRLGPLFVAAQLVDIAYFLFVLLGVERMRLTPGLTAMNAGDFWYMPYTHSLIGSAGFAAAWAIVVRMTGGSWRVAWIGAAVVASHWWLDWLVHAPDLTLLGVGQRHGLALWNRPMVAMPLELGLTALAVTFYASRTRAHGLAGQVMLALLVSILVTLQLIDWLTPQPANMIDPAPATVPLTALAAYTLLALLAFATQHWRRIGGGNAAAML